MREIFKGRQNLLSLQAPHDMAWFCKSPVLCMCVSLLAQLGIVLCCVFSKARQGKGFVQADAIVCEAFSSRVTLERRDALYCDMALSLVLLWGRDGTTTQPAHYNTRSPPIGYIDTIL